MALDLLKVYDKQYHSMVVDTLHQNLELFNQTSGGAIVLNMEAYEGDFIREAIWNGIHDAHRKVDIYAANGDVTPTELSQRENLGVKLMAAFGPVTWNQSELQWILKASPEAVEMVSRNIAEAVLSDQINTCIGAVTAAIENNGASTTVDVSGGSVINQVALNKGYAKFGDKSARIVTNVMNSIAYHQLIESALQNTERLFTARDVNVVDIQGKRTIVTDAPDLFVAGTPDKVKVLGLTQGAVVCSDSTPMTTAIETITGKNKLVTQYQAEYQYALAMKGYNWDTVNGGKSPLDAELKTGANWVANYSDVKESAGVVIIADA